MRGPTNLSVGLVGTLFCMTLVATATQQTSEVKPHGQDSLPGLPLSPQQAISKMKVPEGFSVELVASEPDLVNPVAMTFDEKGRIWITESLEYPRHSAGKGRDRIKVLESSQGDGRYDRVRIFAEGLNIPSGIAVGHGGVWVANAPDLLYYPIDSEGKASGEPRVIVTGFGRSDTHELPNSLTWGPDGWLYGLNGVFNPSHIKHQGKEFHFTCALFRIHPRTHEFQLFCQGTSNPWGIAFDPEGSAFVSACVIDHLWHLTETGYYLRQGGPYPPFVWKLGSIVKHRHQKAAYCGIHYYDSDAYPPEYRGRLYMGNIHGGCLNVDVLERDGSTYFARPNPDFLTANDAWFMPVAQKTGPDGCLYVLDWYDRYHCYQDANRDPKGIDRLNGRLYRIRYKNTPRAGTFDLSRESDQELVARLSSGNGLFRDLAQRILSERSTPEVIQLLEKQVMDESIARRARMHAIWSLVSMGPLSEKIALHLLKNEDPGFRAWGIRSLGNSGTASPALLHRIEELAKEPNPDVLLQIAIAAPKIKGIDPIPLLIQVLRQAGNDKLIPAIVWQNMQPLLEDKGESLQQLSANKQLARHPNVIKLIPMILERVLVSRTFQPGLIAKWVDLVLDANDTEMARRCLQIVASRIQSDEIKPGDQVILARELLPLLRPHLNQSQSQLATEASLVAASLNDPEGLAIARMILQDSKQDSRGLLALEALLSVRDPGLLKIVEKSLKDKRNRSEQVRGQMVSALTQLDDPAVADLLIQSFAEMEPGIQVRAVEVLTQRVGWARALLVSMEKKTIPPSVINVNQVRRLFATGDAELSRLLKKNWGTVREDRNPDREKVVSQMKEFLKGSKGDPVKGIQVFRSVCAQCHKIHGEGQEVGPDITLNGRSTFDQLLSNVFDPSLVIGAAYQGTNILTTEGKVITGLLVEETRDRVVLKLQGGNIETILRQQIEEITLTKLSLMPEGLEKQIKPNELADLFAFLVLDKHPGDPSAKKIPGAP